jgi:hypothetical protein
MVQLMRWAEDQAVTTDILSTTVAYQRTYLDACRLRIRGLEEEVLRLRRVTPMAISVLLDDAEGDRVSHLSTDATSYRVPDEEGEADEEVGLGESSEGNVGATSVLPEGEFPYEDGVRYPPGLSEYRSSRDNGEATSEHLAGGFPEEDRREDGLPDRAQSRRGARLGWWGRIARMFRRRESSWCEGCNECRGVGLENR